MRRLAIPLLAGLLAGCATKVEVDARFPGRAARLVLAHADRASVRRAARGAPVGEVRPVGRWGRNRIVEAMVTLRRDTTGGYLCFCGGFGKHDPERDVTFEVDSDTEGRVALHTVYGCPVAPTLTVTPKRGKGAASFKVEGGDGLQGLYRVYQAAFPGTRATRRGCG